PEAARLKRNLPRRRVARIQQLSPPDTERESHGCGAGERDAFAARNASRTGGGNRAALSRGQNGICSNVRGGQERFTANLRRLRGALLRPPFRDTNCEQGWRAIVRPIHGASQLRDFSKFRN